MLQAICASKLYRASNRKDKILAALNNPVNVELVGQLARNLKTEYKQPEYLVKDYGVEDAEEEDVAVDTSAEEGDATDAGADAGTSHVSAIPHSSSSSASSSREDDSGDTSEPVADGSDSGTDTSTSEPAADGGTSIEVKEASQIKGTPITSATNPFDLRQVAEQIKGLLNFRGTTSGVNRITIKENEFWIYYNDDVNLNNVMTEVIEVLNESAYTYLEFNRLARSDNAIVFQIEFHDTNNIVKRVQK